MRAVVEALRAFPIQPSRGHVCVDCPRCGDGIAFAGSGRETARQAVEWLREHECYCDHIQSWGSRECILCGQSLL